MNGEIEKAAKVQEQLKNWSELKAAKRLLGWPDSGSTGQIIKETNVLQALHDSGYSEIIPGEAFCVPEMLENHKRVLQDRRDICS
jgi:hypothetical protein